MSSTAAPRVFWQTFAGLVAGVLIMAFVPAGGWLVGGLLMLHALRGPRETVEALSLLAVIIMMNRIFVQGNISLLRWAILFAAFGRMLWDSFVLDRSWPPIVRPLFVFITVILVFSLLTSRLPLVSILKIVSFAVGSLTALVSLHRVRELRGYWPSWFCTVGMAVLVLSAPLYVTSLGYTTGAGFQGLLTHPQTMGIFAAIYTAFFVGSLILEHHRGWWLWLGAGLSSFMLFSTLSRTAGLAVVLGLASVYAVRLVTSRWKREGTLFQGDLTRPAFVVLALLVVVVLKGPDIQRAAVNFLLKDDAASSVVASLQASRTGLANRSMQNFYDFPVTGIGFGVPSEARFDRVQTGALGLPVGASTEKGFLPTAVLEETGVVGFGLWVLLIVMLLYRVAERGTATQFWVLCTALLVNAGEAIFFAIGGNGLFMWLMIGFALLPPARARQPKTGA